MSEPWQDTRPDRGPRDAGPSKGDADNDKTPRPDADRKEFAEEAESLFRITLAPLVWAVHFVACYAVISLACAKGALAFGPSRAGLLALSAAALVAIAWLGWRSLRQWGPKNLTEVPQEVGVPEPRHQFLGHAAFLLSIISFIGVVFVTLPLVLIGGCQ